MGPAELSVPNSPVPAPCPCKPASPALPLVPLHSAITVLSCVDVVLFVQLPRWLQGCRGCRSYFFQFVPPFVAGCCAWPGDTSAVRSLAAQIVEERAKAAKAASAAVPPPPVIPGTRMYRKGDNDSDEDDVFGGARRGGKGKKGGDGKKGDKGTGTAGTAGASAAAAAASSGSSGSSSGSSSKPAGAVATTGPPPGISVPAAAAASSDEPAPFVSDGVKFADPERYCSCQATLHKMVRLVVTGAGGMHDRRLIFCCCLRLRFVTAHAWAW